MRTLQLVDTALCYVAGSRAKPLLGRLLHGLYEGGASLHSVWGNADEHLKTCDGGDEPLPDAAEQRSVSEMGEAVRALLAAAKPLAGPNEYPLKVFSSSSTGINRMSTPRGIDPAPIAMEIPQCVRLRPAVFV